MDQKQPTGCGCHSSGISSPNNSNSATNLQRVRLQDFLVTKLNEYYNDKSYQVAKLANDDFKALSSSAMKEYDSNRWGNPDINKMFTIVNNSGKKIFVLPSSKANTVLFQMANSKEWRSITVDRVDGGNEIGYITIDTQTTPYTFIACVSNALDVLCHSCGWEARLACGCCREEVIGACMIFCATGGSHPCGEITVGGGGNSGRGRFKPTPINPTTNIFQNTVPRLA